MPFIPLSPEKYIKTKARTLPIYKCYLTPYWKEEGIANAVVVRRHVNGNVTAGLYMVDLWCMGIKDAFYLFNRTEKELDEKMDLMSGEWEEAEYNLVHNIIFAGHDFAAGFDITPHKDFAVAKFILEEDDDHIPLIEIHVGDDEGNPHLVVAPDYPYQPVLKKLEKNAGPGNFTFDFMYGPDDDKEDNEDEDDDDGDDDFELPESIFDEIEYDYLDYNHIAILDTEALEKELENGERPITDVYVIQTELLLRQLDDREPGTIMPLQLLQEKKEHQLFDNLVDKWQEGYDSIEDEIDEIFPILQKIAANDEGLDDEAMLQQFIIIHDSYRHLPDMGYFIFSTIPFTVLLSNLPVLIKQITNFTPAVQLMLAGFATAKHETYAELKLMYDAPVVEDAFPGNGNIHAMHHKLFWLINAFKALAEKNKTQILHYHNLLRVSGIGGFQRILYVVQVKSWLEEELQ